MFKNKKCRVCEKSALVTYLGAKDYFLGSKKEYGYLLCSKCNSLSIEEIPNDLPQLYKNYYSFSSPKKISFFKKLIYKNILNNTMRCGSFFSKFLKTQEDLPIQSLGQVGLQRDSKVLDVGCGSGSLVWSLHEMGFKNCIGIDPFLESDICYPNGAEVKKQDFFTLDEKFDVIMFHHVFEHFPNPKDVLVHVSKLLSENGICIIRMPHVDSYSFFRYKENWFGIHAPFHLSLPSKKGMEALIRDTGLNINNFTGEQLVEFFFYSMGHELGIADYDQNGNRKFIEQNGVDKIPPLHIKNELRDAKQRLKQVKKHNLCEWACYYLKKD